MLFNLLLVPYLASRRVEEVDYGTFMSLIEDGKLDSVELEENQILFTVKDDSGIYKTGLVNDPTLTERLYNAGVTFSGEIVETASPFQTILLYWILPMAIFAIIGQITVHKMTNRGGNAPNMMSFGMGKSNAKVY
jgi:cell division protease FtsH